MKKLLVLLAFSMVLLCSCSPIAQSIPTIAPKPPSAEEVLHFRRSVLQLNYFSLLIDSELEAYITNIPDASNILDIYYRIQECTEQNASCPDAFLDILVYKTGMSWNGNEYDVVDEEKYDSFVQLLHLDQDNNFRNANTYALSKLAGNPEDELVMMIGQGATYEQLYEQTQEEIAEVMTWSVLRQDLDPIVIALKKALSDNRWSTEDEKSFGINEAQARDISDIDEFVNSIHTFLTKSEGITRQEIEYLFGFELFYTTVIYKNMGIEPVDVTIEGDSRIKVKLNSIQSISLVVTGKDIAEKKYLTNRFVILRLDDSRVFAWKIADDEKYNIVRLLRGQQ